mgnify:CR=1 FL=1
MKNFLIKLFLFQFKIINRHRLKKYGNPQLVDLEEKHLSNSKLIPGRNFLIKNLPINSICAKIGVYEGIF